MIGEGDERRIWVTPNDVANEAAIIDTIKPFCKFEVAIKLPRLYQLDYAVLNGKDITSLLEVKVRPNLVYGFRDGYYIAASKMMAAKNFSLTFGVATFLIICFSDGAIHYTRLDSGSQRLIWGGRSDRQDDPLAKEPHGVIAWSDFRYITKFAGVVKSDNARGQ